MTLHIISKTSQHVSLYRLKSLVSADDTVLLIADACYDFARYQQINGQHLFLLAPDATARLSTDDLAQLNTITHSQWVELTLTHQQIISW
ncbi:DsrH/TusB family sulfur metabolism protein [Pseudoalteromonas ulvae]|uniref:DsrH/TusB family sulfur metabolism protein n=1 Tax=Pseudoalteromonas ulvae TaxID=107327 RepID=UPI00186B8054|nr:DsrH/TusB family sulfur metabolism protein [Pseudoalteromonas ulvae]